MNTVVKARHMDVTDAMKQFVDSKVAKLPRFYDNIQSVEVILDVEGDKPTAEIVVTAKRKNVFVASHRDDDMYVCVDQCLHKITEQLRRHKSRVRDRQGPTHEETLGLTGE